MPLPTMIGPEPPFSWKVSWVRRLCLPKNQMRSNNLSGSNGSMGDPTSHCDHNLLRKRQSQLKDACIAGDLGRVIFLLRISLTRNFAQTSESQVSVLSISNIDYCSLAARPALTPKKSSRNIFQKFKKPSNSWFKWKAHWSQIRTSSAC